ncbi:TIGR02444 family protein [Aquisalimonas asiatica]|uniref:TIGR02444 family protein n=1 Tax=Aquisalimonas asiatica TaxID=406100 RepID=A0A1H8TE85_9GAMM|nr:TIGR02444 family protein [Aquisalimonas asiatica]SEO88793.1 TIGR02444 family protein [Aquisalimonas asiatica]
MPAIVDSESAWQGMVELYALPGMTEVCLRLQDRYGVSVSTLLTLVWSARAGHGPLTVAAAAAVAPDAERLERDVLRPYRHARNGLRGLARQDEAAADLRRDLLTRELALERFVQQRVVHLLRPDDARDAPGDAGRDCRATVARYLAAIPVQDSPELRADLRQFFLALGDTAPDRAVSEVVGGESVP